MPSTKDYQTAISNLVEFPQRAISPSANPPLVSSTALSHDARISPPPSLVRKRGKRMSRRNGQDPTVRSGKRADGSKYYFFQFWADVSGQEERRRMTEVIGPTSQMTKKERGRTEEAGVHFEPEVEFERIPDSIVGNVRRCS